MHVDLGSSESIRDPAGYFRAARERAGAVQWSDVHRGWVVLSHAEAEAGFRDVAGLSADRSEVFGRAAAKHSPAFGIVAELLSGWMNFRDDPAHQRLREPVRAAFTPRAVAALEKDVRETVERTISGFDGDTVELYQAFARPIPALVIAAMLGADPEDRARFQDWSDDLGRDRLLAHAGDGGRGAAGARHAGIRRVLQQADRARAPPPSGNLLSALVHSEAGKLSTIELVGACTLLLFGGHETTTNLIDNALGILLERPELAEELRSDPERWETAIDEFMRVISPARTMARKVTPRTRAAAASSRPGTPSSCRSPRPTTTRRFSRPRPRSTSRARRTRTSASAGGRISAWEPTSRAWKRASRCRPCSSAFRGCGPPPRSLRSPAAPWGSRGGCSSRSSGA